MLEFIIFTIILFEICILIASYVVKKKGIFCKNFLLIGKDNKKTIDKMKKIAYNILDSQIIPNDVYDDYRVLLNISKGQIIEVCVESEFTDVIVNNSENLHEKEKIYQKGFSEKSAILIISTSIFIFTFCFITLTYIFFTNNGLG